MKEVVEIILNSSITALVVLDNGGNITGIVTKRDLLKPVSEMKNPPTKKFFIGASGELDKLSSKEKETVSRELQSFADIIEPKLSEGHLNVNISIHKEKMRKIPMFYCKANLVTDKGKFSASEKGWGIKNALLNTLQELERQIAKRWAKRVEDRRKPTRIVRRDRAR